MAPSRNKIAKSSAKPHRRARYKSDARIQKGKDQKRQQQATKMLQKTLHTLHNPTLGQAYRKAARRWLQTQKETKAIPGRVAQELFLFVRERPIGGRKKGGVEREDLSAEAESTWVRYLGELAEVAGDEEAVARNQAAVRAFVATKEVVGRDGGAVVGEDGGAVGLDDGEDADVGSGDEKEGDGGVMLSPEPHVMDESGDASKTMWEGDLVMLGPGPRQRKEMQIPIH